MKNQKDYLLKLIIVITLVIFGCSPKQENETNSIQVIYSSQEATEETLSKITSEVMPIALETIDDNYVRSVQQITHNDNLLFIADGYSVFKFNTKGKYFGRIVQKGQGPGEYTSVKSMAVNWRTGSIYVATFNKIIQYDLQGKFISENKLESMIDGLITNQTSLKVFITEMGYPSTKPSKSITKTFLLNINNNLEVVDSLLVRSIEVNKGTGALFGNDMQFVSQVNTNEYLYYPVVLKESISRDTLFQIQHGKLIPELKVDFGVNDRFEEHFLIKSIYRSKDHVLVDFFKKSKEHQALINVSTSNSITARDGFEDDIYQTGRALIKPWDLTENEFFFVKDGYELEGVMDGVSEDDNPVIFVFKVKY